MIRRAGSAAGSAAKKVGGWYLRSIFGDVRSDIARTKAIWRRTLALVKRRGGRTETFDEACARMRVSAEDVAARREELKRMAILYAAVAFVAVVLLGTSSLSARPWSQFFVALAAFLACATKSAISRFRCAQIDRRELISFKDWLKGKEE